MKATVVQGLLCDCGAFLGAEHDDNGWMLVCDNASCDYYGKKLVPPKLKLEEKSDAGTDDN